MEKRVCLVAMCLLVMGGGLQADLFEMGVDVYGVELAPVGGVANPPLGGGIVDHDFCIGKFQAFHTPRTTHSDQYNTVLVDPANSAILPEPWTVILLGTGSLLLFRQNHRQRSGG